MVAFATALTASLGAGFGGFFKLALLGLPPLVVLAFMERGLYGRASFKVRDVPVYSLASGWAQALGLLALLGLLIGPATKWLDLPDPAGPVRTALMLCTGFVIGFTSLLAWRFAWRLFGPMIGTPTGDRVVIVGDYAESARILPLLRKQHGVEVVGLIDPSGSLTGRTLDGLRVMAGLAQLTTMVRSGMVDTALVTQGRHDDGATLRSVLEQARVSTLDVKVLPQLSDAAPAGVSLSQVGEIPVIELQRRPLGNRAAFLKRVEDLVVGGAMLIVLLPVMVAIAVAIRMETKGPVFFRQPRVGLNGNVFEMLKFRSMHHHAVDHGAVRQTQRGDPRVTRIGAVLRRHSLDELPQILNVLRGDMSIVGPRPHALAMTAQGMALEEAAEDYPARFRMKPGITGWAQTNGWRGNVDTVEKLVRRVEHDLFYIEHWSIGLDMLILRKTVSCVFSDETAY